MKALFFLGLVGCILVTTGFEILAHQASPEPATLKVSIVIPEIYEFRQDTASPRKLINQHADAHFHVVIENVSGQPILLEGEVNPLSLELIEADGTVLRIAQPGRIGSRRGYAYRLAPGELQVFQVYFTTQEQYHAVKHHAPTYPMWSPEFPFTRNKDKTVTLRAVYEQKPLGPTNKLWAGRVASLPCEVVLVYP